MSLIQYASTELGLLGCNYYVNGGLWYGVLILTFWREQVKKGVMPEPDWNITTLPVQDSRRYVPNHAHPQAEASATKEEISIKYF